MNLRKSIFCAMLVALVVLVFGVVASADPLLMWDPNTEDDLAGYRVYYVPTSQGLTSDTVRMLDVGNVIQYWVMDLPAFPVDGTPMTLAVTAYDLAGNESGFSNTVTYTAPDQVPPKPPSGCYITDVTR